ncbi:MAG: hypothetical protein BWK80_31755 [Desulfobacteraceae bacterium IS3]|nr:MAG: hypothetical protein BWK80_31755 [Desulfobacteraceae bacterium IS3]
MKERKIFVTDDNKFIIVCPICQKEENVSVSEYKDANQPSRIRHKCKCGHTHQLLLERRKFYRRETCLHGVCIGEKNSTEGMLVKDLSLIGMKFEIENKQDFISVGKKLFVEFFLDDEQKTLVRKEVVIKIVSGSLIGAEFCGAEPDDPMDTAIESYLIP